MKDFNNLAGWADIILKPKERSKSMNRQFFIAGVKFRPRQEISDALKLMKVGDRLGLVPEPTNQYDPNAVKLEYNIETPNGVETKFLGYVPKKFSSEVSGMLGIGAPIECIVDAINPNSATWEMFQVTVKIPIEDVEEEGFGEEEVEE